LGRAVSDCDEELPRSARGAKASVKVVFSFATRNRFWLGMMISVVLAHVRQGHQLVGSLKRERAIGTGAIGVIEPEALDRRATDLQFGNVAKSR
jgi:hypothetical protein